MRKLAVKLIVFAMIAHVLVGPVSAETIPLKAESEKMAWGIQGYKIEGDEKVVNAEVTGSPAGAAEIILESKDKGFIATIVMKKTKETLTLDASDPEKGVLWQGDKAVASWTKKDDTYETEGFDSVTNSTAYLVLMNTLQDKDFLASERVKAVTQDVALAWILPVIIVTLPIWCISQCQCCENYHLTNPPPLAPEPSCCGICFSWRCGSF